MRLLLCFVFPPLAVLLCGKPFLLLCVLFTLALWVPGIIFALLVVNNHHADKRTDRIVKELPPGPGLSAASVPFGRGRVAGDGSIGGRVGRRLGRGGRADFSTALWMSEIPRSVP